MTTFVHVAAHGLGVGVVRAMCSGDLAKKGAKIVGNLLGTNGAYCWGLQAESPLKADKLSLVSSDQAIISFPTSDTGVHPGSWGWDGGLQASS